MKRLTLVILLILAHLLPLTAQQMSITEFTRLRRSLFKPSAVAIDKSAVLFDFETYEKGFEFLADGKTPGAADEGENIITVTLPHNTSYLSVSHPVFGRLIWKVPDGKKLKKGNHYRAVLLAGDPTQGYKAPNQWVVFHLNPQNVLLQVDSTTRQVRKDVAEYYLPVGLHTYRAEAPFFEPQEGAFNLTDKTREIIKVNLQPFYSYLTVKTPGNSGDLYIDNARIRKEDATSYRLAEGNHRVAIFVGQKCFYDTLVFVGRAQKKVLDVQVKDLYLRPLKRTDPMYADASGESVQDISATPVKLVSADSLADIWVDRERMGTGHWEGTLSPGFHLAQTVRDGQESTPTTLWIESGFPQEFTLEAHGIVYGLLNVYSNVTGAGIDINGSYFGETPRMIRLDASYRYEVTLTGKGYKSKSVTVLPRANNIVDVYVELKKRRK